MWLDSEGGTRQCRKASGLRACLTGLLVMAAAGQTLRVGELAGRTLVIGDCTACRTSWVTTVTFDVDEEPANRVFTTPGEEDRISCALLELLAGARKLPEEIRRGLVLLNGD